MMATVWGGVAWIVIALAAMVLMAVLGVALTGRRLAAIGPAIGAVCEGCEIVRGPIAPKGYCNTWVAQS